MSRINVVRVCDKFGMHSSTIHGAAKGFAYQLPEFDPRRFRIAMYGVKSPDKASRALEGMGVALRYMNHPKISPAILPTFVRVLRRENADVLHVHGWIAGNFGRIAGKIVGVPTVMHEHGADPAIPRQQRIVDRILSRYTDCAVAVSESVARFLVDYRYVRPERVRVIRSGVPLEDFARLGSELISAEKRKLGIPDGSLVVGAVGRLSTEKGLDCLFEAAKQVLSQRPDVHFLIVGDGPIKDELEEMSRSLGIADKVVFTGFRSDVPVMMSVMSVQVFASRREGTPHTVYEAMAMGQSIVSTPVDGLGEVLRDGQTAVFVEPGNARQLTAAILRLLGDGKLAERLSTNAKEESVKYDVRTTVKNLEDLYEDIYARHRGRAHRSSGSD